MLTVPLKRDVTTLLVLAVLAHSIWCRPTNAADWVQFRGPRGGQPESARPLPADPGPDRHVIWKVELPPGHSSPIISGDRMFLTAVRDKKQLLTLALDRKTGKVLWEREAKYKMLEAIHNIGSHAQCT